MAGHDRLYLTCEVTDKREEGLSTFLYQQELCELAVDLKGGTRELLQLLRKTALPISFHVRSCAHSEDQTSSPDDLSAPFLGDVVLSKSSVSVLILGHAKLKVRVPHVPPGTHLRYQLVVTIEEGALVDAGLPGGIQVESAAMTFVCFKRRFGRARSFAGKRSATQASLASPLPTKQVAKGTSVERQEPAGSDSWARALQCLHSLTHSQPLAKCPIDFQDSILQRGNPALTAWLLGSAAEPRAVQCVGGPGTGTTTKAISILQQVLATGSVDVLLLAVAGGSHSQTQFWSFCGGGGPTTISLEGFQGLASDHSKCSLLFLDGFEDTASSLVGVLLPVPWTRILVCSRTYTGYLEGAANAVRCLTAPMSIHRATHLMMTGLRTITRPSGGAAVRVDTNVNSFARFLAEMAHCNPRAMIHLAGSIRCLAATAPVPEAHIRTWLSSGRVLLSATGMMDHYHASFTALAASDQEMVTLLGWMCPSILALEWVQAVEKALSLEIVPLLFRMLQTLWVHIDETGTSFRLDPFLRSYILACTEKPRSEVAARVVGLTMERVEDVVRTSVVTGSTVAAELDPRQWDVENVASALLEKEEESPSKHPFLSIVCHGYKVLQLFLPPADRQRLYARALAILAEAQAPLGSEHYRFHAVALNAHGIALLQLGSYEEALDRFQRSLKMFEALAEVKEGQMESAMVRHNVGYAMAKNGDAVLGLEQLRLAEQHKLALQETHGLGTASGRVHPMLASAITFNASLASTRDSIGEVHFLLGQDEDALFHFDRAIALRKGDCEGLCCCSASASSAGSCSAPPIASIASVPPPEGTLVCQCSRTTNLGLATSYLHKAKLMFRLAKFEVAGRLLKRAIGIRQRVLGSSNYLAVEAKQLGEKLLHEFQRSHQEVDPLDTLTCCSPTQPGEQGCSSTAAAAAVAAFESDPPGESRNDDAIFNVGTWLQGVTSRTEPAVRPADVDGTAGGDWSARQQLAFLMGSTNDTDSLRPEDVLDIDWLLM